MSDSDDLRKDAERQNDGTASSLSLPKRQKRTLGSGGPDGTAAMGHAVPVHLHAKPAQNPVPQSNTEEDCHGPRMPVGVVPESPDHGPPQAQAAGYVSLGSLCCTVHEPNRVTDFTTTHVK